MWQTLGYYATLGIESVVGFFGIRLYEEPPYVVRDRIGKAIEVRLYAPRLAAEAVVPTPALPGSPSVSRTRCSTMFRSRCHSYAATRRRCA